MFCSPTLTNMPSKWPGRPGWTLEFSTSSVSHHNMTVGKANPSLPQFFSLLPPPHTAKGLTVMLVNNPAHMSMLCAHMYTHAHISSIAPVSKGTTWKRGLGMSLGLFEQEIPKSQVPIEYSRRGSPSLSATDSSPCGEVSSMGGQGGARARTRLVDLPLTVG